MVAEGFLEPVESLPLASATPADPARGAGEGRMANREWRPSDDAGPAWQNGGRMVAEGFSEVATAGAWWGGRLASPRDEKFLREGGGRLRFLSSGCMWTG